MHHVTARGIERREIFCDRDDRHDFLARLARVADDFGLLVYAWGLMPNHFHLLTRSGEVGISRSMQRLLSGYALRFNRRHQRCGHLFQNRFKSTLVDSQAYLLELVRNGKVRRDHWIEPWEVAKILDFHSRHPLEGYRRLTFMMLDADVVAVSPSTTYRVLHRAGVLDSWNGKQSKKGTGFVQPLRAHAYWPIDVSYLNIASTFYYLCAVLQGNDRAAQPCEQGVGCAAADTLSISRG